MKKEIEKNVEKHLVIFLEAFRNGRFLAKKDIFFKNNKCFMFQDYMGVVFDVKQKNAEVLEHYVYNAKMVKKRKADANEFNEVLNIIDKANKNAKHHYHITPDFFKDVSEKMIVRFSIVKQDIKIVSYAGYAYDICNYTYVNITAKFLANIARAYKNIVNMEIFISPYLYDMAKIIVVDENNKEISQWFVVPLC